MSCREEIEYIAKRKNEKSKCGHDHIEFGCPSCLETKLGTCSNIHHNKENESDTPAVMTKGSSTCTCGERDMCDNCSTSKNEESERKDHGISEDRWWINTAPSPEFKLEGCNGCGSGSGKSNAGDMGKMANQGFTRDDSQTATRLLDKNWSPLIVRKYYVANWPLWIGIICDCNLNDLDKVVLNIVDRAKGYGFLDGNIQDVRNFCGFMSDEIDKHYNSIKNGSVEGLAVAWYVDKCFCSSLAKDHMVHKSCRDEFYSIIKTLPHI